jgi:hypothetical protein
MAAQPMIPQKMIDECMERLLPDEKERADPWKRFEALTTHIMRGAGTEKSKPKEAKRG